MDVVIEFCFSDAASKGLNEKTVLPHIMLYAFNVEIGSTKRFSPLEEYAVDESPVIRSFILQQLFTK